MGTFFRYIFQLTSRYHWLAIALLIAFTAITTYLALQLRFTEDITRVLPNSKSISQMTFVMDNAELLDNVIFNITLQDTLDEPDPLLLSRFANQFADSLEPHFKPAHIKSIATPPDEADMLNLYNEVYQNLPVFLTTEDYAHIDSMITEEYIRNTLESNYRTLISPMGLGIKKMIVKDPLSLTPIVLEKMRAMQVSDRMKVSHGHFFTLDNRNLILIITPHSTNNTSLNQELFEGIDRISRNLITGDYYGINLEYFGSPAVALGNAQRIKKDIILTVSLAFILLIFLISIFFRSKRSFLIVFIPVVFGAVVSVAFLYLFRQEVSAIALGIGSVLVGISLDYSLHILSHFRQHRDTKSLFKDLATPVIMSSITTAGAFISLTFVNSRALNDLGIFAAVSVISAALFSLVVLPHFLPSPGSKENKHETGFLQRLASFQVSRIPLINLGIVIMTIAFLYFSSDVVFEADLMKSNYISPELQQAEQNLNRVTNLSKKTVYMVAPGTTLDQAIRYNERNVKLIDSLMAEGIIEDALLFNSILGSQESQEKAIKDWHYFWNERKAYLEQAMTLGGEEFGFKHTAFIPFYNWLSSDFKPVSLQEVPQLNNLFLKNLMIQTDSLSAVINVVRINSDEASIEVFYKATEGWQEAWIIDKRQITSEFIGILKENFDKLLVISLSMVFLILLIAYGRIELALVTMVPVVISWIWTVGLMGLAGIPFNIFNIIILTFIFGLGIDYSIFIMRGLLQQYKYGHLNISSYKVSVIISVITTLLGIGVLIFAKHPALRSIALMSIIGILNVVFITFTLLPAIFNWMVNYKKGKRNRPVTLLDFLFSLASLIVFVGGALLMTVFSFILRIIPFNTKKKKALFHIVFSKLTWFLIYMNFLSPKRIINPHKEEYDPPAVIIANHQSHIDLMLMMLLNPRVLILTNRRNYTHPFYGKALQYADFLPSDMGYDAIAEDLKQLIADGYSFMIFPEGHRNDDGTIRRFHKGAFFLADKLNIEILPIIIHGQNQLLKKSEFFLKRGSIHTKFLPRIDISGDRYGETLREKTKNVNSWFRKEYALARAEYETPEYWVDYIIKNFTYKGPVLEWYTRIKLRLENNYRFYNSIIPRQCEITDLGCGYGYLDFMLSLVSEDRVIKAYDYDAEKIEIARNCAINNNNISFFVKDIMTMEYEESDVFILNDVLHYLPADHQEETIIKCLEKTNPGGLVIIRDADKALKKRHLGTRISEFFSTNFGFNKLEHKLEFISRDIIEKIARDQKTSLEIVDKTRLNSNLVYLLRKL